MTAPVITMKQLLDGVEKYKANVRPWTQTLNRVDWFLLISGELYPLKYTYALAADCPPSTYSTNQMKAVLKKLPVEFVSIKGQKDAQSSFFDEVEAALKDSAKRQKRLKEASQKPAMRLTYQAEFIRNADVVAEVLVRAKGKCECCGESAPFLRSKDGSPYLEVHHKVFLSNGGEDSVENAEALCPNCHREKHFG
ncbi:HNH endonuclease signature motif containing protein [Marinobacter sp. M216]|uniref:HNH endonuclease signature motif containing protein n=1 Tax=Marinobacter albus TaxID=3030833 RepID=A0ABT7H832_9GAMM|nr:HNH endonuclease signature motif containing protein [Marinobacter sp. M216]MDK9556102.1 HNH endonuclease signature motif containing protein [Marinobacter sp. M216]